MTAEFDDKALTGPSAGAMLRQARERCGMTVDAAAEALHLKPHVVEALEAERFEALPPRTFVRGYLRNYARLLRLDEGEVLTAFDRHVPEEQAPPLSAGAGVPRGASAAAVPRGLLAALGVLAVLAAMYWWLGGGLSQIAPEPTAVEPAGASTRVAPPEAAPAPRASAPEVPEASVPVEPATPADGAVEPPADSAPAVETLPAEPPAAEAPIDPAASLESIVATQPPPAQVPLLTVQVDGESWVQITDGNGRRVFADLVRGPRELEFDGSAPFTLVIGDAANAGIRFAGEAIDLGPHTRGKVARLTLP